MISVRNEVLSDIHAREDLLEAAMGEARFRKTSQRLRDGRMAAHGLSFVAENNEGDIVGTVRLWDVTAGPNRPSLLLGPLAVDPRLQARGTGSLLMRAAIARAAELGHGSVMLVGDAPYYARFGFTAERTQRLRLPGPYESQRFLALELQPNALVGAAGLVKATGIRVPEPAFTAAELREAA